MSAETVSNSSRALRLTTGGLLLAVATLSGACGESDPYAVIEAQRAQYTAQAQGFYVDERVIDREPIMDADGNEVSIEPIIEKDILFDMLVQSEADQALSGLTVDFEHVDSSGNIKSERKIYLDISAVGRGNVGSFSETLTNVDYTEGDGFTVNVRSPIPEAERSQYREFDAAQGS